ncbi:MAG: hypothetical protein ACXABN_14655 [Candidatus Thorarchaeota archaeon]|jgi:hypothetical protein
MKYTAIIAAAILSLLVLGLTTFPASAHGSQEENMYGMMPGMPGMGHMPGYEMGDDAVWISTDVITIMAMEEMPAFNFWYNSDNNGSMARFMAAYTMISEFEDANGDDAYQFNETLYAAPLGAYEWTLQTGSIENQDGVTTEVWLKYTKSGIHEGGPGDDHMMPGIDMMSPLYGEVSDINRFEDVTLQFWAHIYFEDYNGSISDSEGNSTNYTIAGGTELKIDIEIGNFPFSNENSNVAIQTMLNENMGMGSMMQQSHMSGNSMMDWSTEYGNETRFDNVMGTHMQQIDFIDAISRTTQGFYKWLNQAVISWPGGLSETVNVTASYVPTGMGLSVFLAYPNFGNGSLLHDPSIGLIEGSNPLSLTPLNPLAIGSIIVFAVLVLAVVAIRRR